MEDFERAISCGQVTNALSNILTKPLQYFSNSPLNIAVVGEPESGKSSFINAMLDLSPDDPGAAETGLDGTVEVKSYPLPTLPQVFLWDHPGIGTLSFAKTDFAQKVNLNSYDFFIIISFKRFKTIHSDLVHEIQGMGKRFYFVRTRADMDLEASKSQRPSTYNEDEIIQVIKEDCVHGLRKDGVTNPQVFIVSTWENSRFDFPLLREKLKNDLLRLKRQAVLISFFNRCLPILDKKKDGMKKMILTQALWLGVIGVLPVPGLSFFPALFLSMKFKSWCYHSFGLDDQSLTEISHLVGKTVVALKAEMKPLTTTSVALWRLTDLIGAFVMIEEHRHWHSFPVIGCLVSGAISVLSSYVLLKQCILGAAADTQMVLSEAVKEEQNKLV